MKYKEYRVLIFTSVLGILMLCADTVFLFNKDIFRFFIGLVIISMVVITTLVRYNMKVGKDYVVIYEFRYAGFIPAVIDFYKIKKVTQISKHKVEIVHEKRTSNIYIVDATTFTHELNEKIKQYEDNLIDE